MASLSNSPRGAAVRQGLDIIEQAHRLGGGAKLRMAGPVAPSSGEICGQPGVQQAGL